MSQLSITRVADRRGWRLVSTQTLPHRIEQVFAFFANAANLQEITPPWLHFKVLSPTPIEMRRGMRIDYKLRLRFVRLRWQSLISEWDPPHRFVDEQVRGPYRWWRHEHVFEARDGGTVVRDAVDYGVRGGAIVHNLLVRRDLERIFAYRQEALAARFA